MLRAGLHVCMHRDDGGVLRSEAFPGLWHDGQALLRGDDAAMHAALRLGLATPEHSAFAARLER